MQRLATLTLLTTLTTCAALGTHVASTSAQPADKSVGDSAGVTAAADPAGGYYAISSDLRRCATPLCGGWFLSQLNRSTTQCHDRRTAEQCYTPVLDWSNTGLSEEQRAELLAASQSSAVSRQVYAIVRGSFAPTNSTTQPTLGRFVVTEAWVAEGDAPASGTFVWVHDNGLRCLVAPCPNLTERTLNTSQVTDIADIDFAPAGLTDAEREVCTAAMYGPNGLIVAGQRYTVQANGNTAPGRTATEAYRRVDEPDVTQ